MTETPSAGHEPDLSDLLLEYYRNIPPGLLGLLKGVDGNLAGKISELTGLDPQYVTLGLNTVKQIGILARSKEQSAPKLKENLVQGLLQAGLASEDPQIQKFSTLVNTAHDLYWQARSEKNPGKPPP